MSLLLLDTISCQQNCTINEIGSSLWFAGCELSSLNLNYGSVALLSHFAKCKNRKCENKKCEKTSMAQNA